MTARIGVDTIELVEELYPRFKQDDAAIERYRASLEQLPPIVVARGGILVDGFHRWQAHRKEGATTVEVEDLGDIPDAEILRESIRRNATHGQQLAIADKRRLAGKLWLMAFADLPGPARMAEVASLLSVSERSVERWTQEARKYEKQLQRERAWDLWLNCFSYRQIAEQIGVDDTTVAEWCAGFATDVGNPAPDPLPHADVWTFGKAADEGDGSHFGRMPAQAVENLLWLYTEPGEIVVDPFAGGGTTIEVAKRMCRRVWASDLSPGNPLLPIHEHDIAAGWPEAAPKKASLILLDPPYWKQAKGRYSKNPRDLGNMSYEDFLAAWEATVAACVSHLEKGGRLAFIVGSTLEKQRPINHADDMIPACRNAGLEVRQRIIVPYTSEQLNGNLVTLARDGRYLLATYRDLVVLG
ncbi:MAG: DNA methyltransferase [Gaiellaceae bacterium]